MARISIAPTFLFILLIVGVLVALGLPLPLPELRAAMVNRETLFALKLSLGCACAATVFSLIWGVPVAYLLARKTFRGKFIIDTVLDIPMIVPPLVTGVGLLFLFGRSMLGKPLAMVGIHFLFTPLGACLAQTFIAVPMIIRTSRVAFEAVDIHYEHAAQTLGSPPLAVFFGVTLPLSANGILSGAILAMARAMGEFGATLMVAGATRFKTETLPMAVYLNIASGEMGIALASAWILMFSGLLLLMTLKILGAMTRN